MIDDVFGKRYGEVLLVGVAESGPEAAAAALLNNPGYWLMSSIGKGEKLRSARASVGSR